MIATKSLGLAVALDLLAEELPEKIHPVGYYGRALGWVDREWRYPGIVGGLVAVSLPSSVAALAWGVTTIATEWEPLLGVVIAGLVLFATMSHRMLVRLSRVVIDESTADVDAARESVIGLVGRDASGLSPAQLRSAALESAAENLSDGLVAPLFAFVIGAQLSLAVGVAGAVWVKAVNTNDSMLGYRDKPHGRASARLDDAVMWMPARITAVLLAIAGRKPGALDPASDWQRETTSPNAGWPMATMAAVLNVRLSKPGVYELNPDSSLPSATQSRAGVRIVWMAGLFAFGLAAILTAVPALVSVSTTVTLGGVHSGSCLLEVSQPWP